MRQDFSKSPSGKLPGITTPRGKSGEAHYQAVIELLPQIAWLADADSKVTYCNQPWYKFSGFTQEQSLGDGWASILHPADRERAVANLQNAATTFAPRQGEYRFRRALDGEYRWHLVQITSLADVLGRANKWMGIAIDIHDQRMARTKLASRDEQLSLVVDAARLGIWESDEVTGELFVSPRYREIFGLAPDIVFDREKFLALIHPDDRPEVQSILERALAGEGAPEFDSEFRIVRSDGQVRWIVAKGRLRFADRESKHELVGSVGTVQDVTAQKLASEALLASEAHLRAILNAEPECVKLLSPECVLREMNAAGLKMIEADSPDQVLDHSMLPLVDEQYREGFAEITKQVFAGNPGRLEFQITGLRGTRRWLETHATPLKDRSGKVEALLGVTRDITDQKQAEAALRASEARFRALIENSNDAIALFDADWNFAYATAGTERILGYQPSELLNTSGLMLCHPDDIPGIGPLLEDCLANPGKTVTVVARLRHKDGSWRITEGVLTNLLHDADVQAVVNNFRDITARVEAESALRLSEEKFKRAFRSSPDAITISTLKGGRYIDVNDAFMRLTGWDRDEVIGQTSFNLGIWVDIKDREKMLRTLADLGRVSALETSFRKKSGDVVFVQMSAEVVLIEGVECLLIITRDVTQQRAMEKQLRIAQKMEAMGQLAGGIAHDFNNLLMIMGSRAELIMEGKHRPHDVVRQAQEIVNATRRAATLTRQLLAFSRDQVLQPAVLNLGTLVQELGNMLPRLIGEHVETRIVTDPAPTLVRVDRGQFEQVVMNLAINARDAMPRGGILTIETRRVTFSEQPGDRPEPVPPGQYVMLTVSDSGIGMTPEIQSRIFEPFFTTKEHGKGTGLGLAMVYGIVQQNRGHICVESELGKGTTFRLYLNPVESGINAASQEQPITSAGGSETVLFVEDEDALREVGSEALRAKGYTVLAAANGEEAMDICQSCPIDLLITDVVMPRMGGVDLARQVLKLHPQARVIYVSGYSGHALAGEIAGRDTMFLQKPFEITLLATHARAALDRQTQPHN